MEKRALKHVKVIFLFGKGRWSCKKTGVLKTQPLRLRLYRLGSRADRNATAATTINGGVRNRSSFVRVGVLSIINNSTAYHIPRIPYIMFTSAPRSRYAGMRRVPIARDYISRATRGHYARGHGRYAGDPPTTSCRLPTGQKSANQSALRFGEGNAR